MLHLLRAPIIVAEKLFLFVRCSGRWIIMIWTADTIFGSFDWFSRRISYCLFFSTRIERARVSFLSCVLFFLLKFSFYNFCCAHTLFPCLFVMVVDVVGFLHSILLFDFTLLFMKMSQAALLYVWFPFQFDKETHKCTHRLLPSSSRRCKHWRPIQHAN